MTIDKMKDKLYSVYPNNTWRNKVNAMHDNQVVAVFNKFKEEGRFNIKKERKTNEEQLSFF